MTYTHVYTHVSVCNGHSVSPAVPSLITAEIPIISDTEITIDWSSSSGVGGDIVRYIVNVRVYSSDGPGKVTTSSVASYPQQLPGTQRDLTVKSLGKTAAILLCAPVVYTECLCAPVVYTECLCAPVVYTECLCAPVVYTECLCAPVVYTECLCAPVVYTECCAPVQWARCRMTCSSWPGMSRGVERRSLQTPSSPVKDVGVSASGPCTARGVCCVELSQCSLLTHSSAERSSQCEGGETQRHHHERLLHQTEHRGGSRSQRCLHRQILTPDLGRQEAGTVPEYGGS